MNHEVEKIALNRGHEIVFTIDNQAEWESFKKSNINSDLVIDFSMPGVAVNNFMACFELGLPVVTGTTGWYEHLENVKKHCKENRCTFFYAPNFSLGVNVFFHINRQLAKIMDGLTNYNVKIDEAHHANKLDAPSGTALKIVDDIIGNSKRFTGWTHEESEITSDIVVSSERIGDVPGMHKVTWESEADRLILMHEAKNRKGFAFGAVLAAEFLLGKKNGIYTMENLLKSIL